MEDDQSLVTASYQTDTVYIVYIDGLFLDTGFKPSSCALLLLMASVYIYFFVLNMSVCRLFFVNVLLFCLVPVLIQIHGHF